MSLLPSVALCTQGPAAGFPECMSLACPTGQYQSALMPFSALCSAFSQLHLLIYHLILSSGPGPPSIRGYGDVLPICSNAKTQAPTHPLAVTPRTTRPVCSA